MSTSNKEISSENIKSFWQLPPKMREAMRKLADRIEKRAQLEQYAEENNMLICRGKVYTWEEYPCDCEMGDPEECQAEKNERRGLGHVSAVCKCRCHLLYEPF
jgi:hypothetical protein